MRSTSLLLWLAVLSLSNGILILPRGVGGEDAMRVASSSIASPMPYIVLSRSDATQEAVQTIKSTLAKDAVSDSLTWMTSARTGLAVLFQANITSQQAGVIASLTGVAHVVPDSPVLETQPHPVALIQSSTADKLASLEIAARAPQKPCSIGLQRNAPDELKVISQPKGAKLADLPGFGYGAEAGKGVTIYTIDTGANTGNSEWTGMRGTHRFMYAPGAPHLESDTLNHGSCVASKAAGPMYGTAKNANLVMVKMSYQLRLSDFYATLVEVRNDIEAKRLRGKAVINMSVLLRIEDPSKQTDAVDGLRTLLLDLMADDVVVVTGSGNDRYEGVEDVTQFPATLGPTTNIIVVGGVDNDGSRAAFSQGTGNQLTVSAPAFVTCASGRGPGPQNSRGTSYAAPTVAGVIAVWLSQDMYNARLRVPGRVAANVKAMLKELAYPRILTGPPVVWNGVDPRKRSWLGSLCGAK